MPSSVASSSPAADTYGIIKTHPHQTQNMTSNWVPDATFRPQNVHQRNIRSADARPWCWNSGTRQIRGDYCYCVIVLPSSTLSAPKPWLRYIQRILASARGVRITICNFQHRHQIHYIPRYLTARLTRKRFTLYSQISFFIDMQPHLEMPIYQKDRTT